VLLKPDTREELADLDPQTRMERTLASYDVHNPGSLIWRIRVGTNNMKQGFRR
jgi:hypothetical protein